MGRHRRSDGCVVYGRRDFPLYIRQLWHVEARTCVWMTCDQMDGTYQTILLSHTETRSRIAFERHIHVCDAMEINMRDDRLVMIKQAIIIQTHTETTECG